MRPPEDDILLESSLRQAMSRRRVPPGLQGKVMAAVRTAQTGQRMRQAPSSAFAWLPSRSSWALGAYAAIAAAALVLLVGPSRQDRVGTEVASLGGAELELAEALQLAGHKWNKAQEAALSPIQGDPNE